MLIKQIVVLLVLPQLFTGFDFNSINLLASISSN